MFNFLTLIPFRFFFAKSSRLDTALGAVGDVSLAEARVLATTARKLLRSGVDPIEARRAERQKKRLISGMTFAQCATAYIDAHKAGWRSAKYAKQWFITLASYAYPVFGDLPVQMVDLALVLKVLEPIW